MDKLKELELIRNDVNRWIKQLETSNIHSVWIGQALIHVWNKLYRKKELIKIKEFIQRKQYIEAKQAYEKFKKDYPEFK